ncbi:protein translocase subunit SecF [Arhodomonas sp. AD133]|uniref:protein translocase subunit SecF n=1 Tax=Arhodomonas sp. AD133 TaxID=3415009 RepID=UPI003EBC9C4F
MDLFKRETRIDFIGKRRIAAVVSLLLIAIAIASLAIRGLNFGLDFTGGTLVEVGYEAPVELGEVRTDLADAGLDGAVVQYFGTSRDVLIRIPPDTATGERVGDRVLAAVQDDGTGAELRRVEFVGPQVGEELKEKGGLAMLYALAGILAYVAFRFEYRFALGSVAALVHDVTITLGFFSVTGVEFDLTVLAALLAVIGYSLNDTIVVFDRIRENFVRVRKGTPMEVANMSINQTLGRTLMTSVTTLVVVVALAVLGGELIKPFAEALVVGIVIGTFSSVFVASTLALALGVSKEDLIPPEKEGADQEELP